MLRINTDLSIEITRGDAAEFVVTVKDNGENYVFKIGDIVRFKVFEKKGCDCVVLQKDFGVESDTEEVTIVLEEADTKIGGLINKPKDYWYEVELNPDTLPCTIIGYDEAGAKVFKLYPEGRDLEADPITPEDIPFVDRELDLTSHNPVENQAIAREFDKVNGTIKENADTTAEELSNKLSRSGGTMTGNLSMGGKKLTGLAEPENDADAVHLGYANRKYAPKSHTEDKQNPHNVTAAQVGARPNTWMPTANDVGARPNTWMPTFTEIGAVPTSRTVNGKALSSDISLSASDVGARPSSWMPTASQVGAVPTSRTVNGKALSSNISLSASDVGARPDNWLPTVAEIGAQKIIGIGQITGDLNDYEKLRDTICWVNGNSVSNSPTTNFAVVETWSNGGGIILQRITTVNHNVALRVRYNGEWTEWGWISPPMSIGIEYRLAERWNGKVVYCKVISCGALPAAGSSNTIAMGLSNNPTRILRHCGYAKDTSGPAVSLPIVEVNGGVTVGYHVVGDGNIYMSCTANAKETNKYTSSYVAVWYTKD